MTTEHPITPPPELVKQWTSNFYGAATVPGEASFFIATQAARWGADQELDACCDWIYKLFQRGLEWSKDLRAARRPKPPSLKQQAQRILVENGTTLDGRIELEPEDIITISRALAALPDE